MPRFVVQYHKTAWSHRDLMFRRAGVLKSWSVDARVDLGRVRRFAAKQIFDHRLRYLRYEGPISPDRGSVRIWDLGSYAVSAWKENRMEVKIRGSRWKGTWSAVRLRRFPPLPHRPPLSRGQTRWVFERIDGRGKRVGACVQRIDPGNRSALGGNRG